VVRQLRGGAKDGARQCQALPGGECRQLCRAARQARRGVEAADAIDEAFFTHALELALRFNEYGEPEQQGVPIEGRAQDGPGAGAEGVVLLGAGYAPGDEEHDGRRHRERAERAVDAVAERGNGGVDHERIGRGGVGVLEDLGLVVSTADAEPLGVERVGQLLPQPAIRGGDENQRFWMRCTTKIRHDKPRATSRRGRGNAILPRGAEG